jgi:outer membrane protein assembly factor BamD
MTRNNPRTTPPQSATERYVPLNVQWFRRVVWVCLPALVALTLSACGGGNRSIRPEAISDSARLAYLQGLDSLESGNYVDAVGYFQVVAKSPSYVKWASLARLRIADAMFFQDKFSEAIEQYMAFLNQYQGDPNEAYAHFMIARSYYEQMPTDWFVTPPAYEKDLTATQRAKEKLQAFVRLYGRSRFVPEAQRMLEDVRRMQYDHSAYVADFYESRDQPAGVVERLQYMRREFPDLFDSPEGFMRLGKALIEAGRPVDAYEAYQEYLQRFPDGEYAGTAREHIRELERVLRKRGEDVPTVVPDDPSGQAPAGETEGGTVPPEGEDVPANQSEGD